MWPLADKPVGVWEGTGLNKTQSQDSHSINRQGFAPRILLEGSIASETLKKKGITIVCRGLVNRAVN